MSTIRRYEISTVGGPFLKRLEQYKPILAAGIKWAAIPLNPPIVEFWVESFPTDDSLVFRSFIALQVGAVIPDNAYYRATCPSMTSETYHLFEIIP